jgi:hypothetical protein
MSRICTVRVSDSDVGIVFECTTPNPDDLLRVGEVLALIADEGWQSTDAPVVRVEPAGEIGVAVEASEPYVGATPEGAREFTFESDKELLVKGLGVVIRAQRGGRSAAFAVGLVPVSRAQLRDPFELLGLVRLPPPKPTITPQSLWAGKPRFEAPVKVGAPPR